VFIPVKGCHGVATSVRSSSRTFLTTQAITPPTVGRRNSTANLLEEDDRAVHDWYRFVLSFPPHLVRHYAEKLGFHSGSLVLDPFCGTGTTIVECRKLGIPCIGVEAHPMTCFAAQVKLDWSPDPKALQKHAADVARIADRRLARQKVPDSPLFGVGRPAALIALQKLSPEQEKLLLENSISPRPLHKALVLLETMRERRDDRYHSHELLALAKTLVFSSSNLVFGPEVGVGPPKQDAAVVGPWLENVGSMATDLAAVRSLVGVPSTVRRADARDLSSVISPQSVTGVFTSPPYPNEKDYTRTTRLESVLLSFLSNREELRAIKRGLVRSNTRGIYKIDDDDLWVKGHPEIQGIAEAIERRRLELGKTSGFERMYPRAARLYFGGMARHLANLRPALAPGAKLAYVVGDQASYLRVMIRTGAILAGLAADLGYDVVGIDLFRTRLATATREQLREEVVVLRWPGV
jgi:DNA modification methylase